MKARPVQDVPRIALTQEEAAASLGVSVSHYRRHIQPHLKIVRSGSARLVAPAELQRYVDQQARLAGAEDVAA